MTIEITEEQRQGILLALAKLSLPRPGWHSHFLTPIAELLQGKEMYEAFRAQGPDTPNWITTTWEEVPIVASTGSALGKLYHDPQTGYYRWEASEQPRADLFSDLLKAASKMVAVTHFSGCIDGSTQEARDHLENTIALCRISPDKS
jgi:hypothetical protein